MLYFIKFIGLLLLGGRYFKRHRTFCFSRKISEKTLYRVGLTSWANGTKLPPKAHPEAKDITQMENLPTEFFSCSRQRADESRRSEAVVGGDAERFLREHALLVFEQFGTNLTVETKKLATHSDKLSWLSFPAEPPNVSSTFFSVIGCARSECKMPTSIRFVRSSTLPRHPGPLPYLLMWMLVDFSVTGISGNILSSPPYVPEVVGGLKSTSRGFKSWKLQSQCERFAVVKNRFSYNVVSVNTEMVVRAIKLRSCSIFLTTFKLTLFWWINGSVEVFDQRLRQRWIYKFISSYTDAIENTASAVICFMDNIAKLSGCHVLVSHMPPSRECVYIIVYMRCTFHLFLPSTFSQQVLCAFKEYICYWFIYMILVVLFYFFCIRSS